MTLKSYSNLRLKDFWGWLNSRDGNTNIQDNQCLESIWFTSQGNRIVSVPWAKNEIYARSFSTPSDPFIGDWQGMTSYWEWVFWLYNNYIAAWKVGENGDAEVAYWYDSVSWKYQKIVDFAEQYTSVVAPSPKVRLWNMAAWFLWDIYVGVVDSFGFWAIKIYKFDPLTGNFTTMSPVGLPWVKFTSIAFYQGRLYLWGADTNPASIYYSKSWTIATPSDSYDFSWYPSGSQVVWDGSSPVTGINVIKNDLLISTASSIWKVSWTFDDKVSKFWYQLDNVSSNWVINQQCLCHVEQDTLFYDGHSIRKLSYESGGSSWYSGWLRDSSISEIIAPTLRTLANDQTLAVSWFTYPYYKLALRSNTLVSYNDTIVWYNIIDKTFFVQTWLNVSCATSVVSDRKYAYVGWYKTRFAMLDNIKSYWYEYDSTISNIYRSFRSKDYSLIDDVDFKRYAQLELSGNISPNTKYHVDVVIDWMVIDTRTIYKPSSIWNTTGSSTSGATMSGAAGNNTETMVSYSERYEYFHDGRRFQFRIYSTEPWYIELTNANIMWKEVPAYPIH